MAQQGILSLSIQDRQALYRSYMPWITPKGAAGNRKAGIGVQFSDTPDGAHARTVIESHLATSLKSNKSTHTM